MSFHRLKVFTRWIWRNCAHLTLRSGRLGKTIYCLAVGRSKKLPHTMARSNQCEPLSHIAVEGLVGQFLRILYSKPKSARMNALVLKPDLQKNSNRLKNYMKALVLPIAGRLVIIRKIPIACL